MGSKCKVQAMSRLAIRHYAQNLRKRLGLENTMRVDILYLAENIFPILFQKYGYNFMVLSKEEMGRNHGLTNPKSGQVMIREDIYEGACKGVGRDRMTIAHELGHFLLHDGITLGLARVDPAENIPCYCDPEWQAKAFAGEFLMSADLISHMSPEEIARECGVSVQAAECQKRTLK